MIPLTAKKLAKLINTSTPALSNYAIQKGPLKNNQLDNFHQWADRRECLGAFLVKNTTTNTSLWILIIAWTGDDNHHIILFPESRSGPIAEMHKTENTNNEITLHWKYVPKKQDGRNGMRRDYFSRAFQSLDVVISVPNRNEEVEEFFDELFWLATCRLKADELSPELPTNRDSFPEGRRKQIMHYARERNSELIRKAKEREMTQHGALTCACCGFNFALRYGKVGEGFIEAHHTVPVSELHPNGGETRLEDIALVCANRHRMLHRRRPWLKIDELTKLLSHS